MQEQIELIVSGGAALRAIAEVNKSLVGTEQTAEGANQKLQASVDKLTAFVVQSQDRQTRSVIGLTERIERQTEAWNRTPIQQKNAELERHIQTIRNSGVAMDVQNAAIQSVTANYQKQIATLTEVNAVQGITTRQGGLLAKTLETGNINSTRAVGALLSQIKVLGPAMSAAFSAFSVLALVDVLYQAGKAAVDFVKKIEEAPMKARMAFHELNASINTTNDEIELSIVKLQNMTAKYEHRPQNPMREALYAARVEADKLGQSIEGDFAKLQKTLEEQGSPDVATHLKQAKRQIAEFDDQIHDLSLPTPKGVNETEWRKNLALRVTGKSDTTIQELETRRQRIIDEIRKDFENAITLRLRFEQDLQTIKDNSNKYSFPIIGGPEDPLHPFGKRAPAKPTTQAPATHQEMGMLGSFLPSFLFSTPPPTCGIPGNPPCPWQNTGDVKHTAGEWFGKVKSDLLGPSMSDAQMKSLMQGADLYPQWNKDAWHPGEPVRTKNFGFTGGRIAKGAALYSMAPFIEAEMAASATQAALAKAAPELEKWNIDPATVAQALNRGGWGGQLFERFLPRLAFDPQLALTDVAQKALMGGRLAGVAAGTWSVASDLFGAQGTSQPKAAIRPEGNQLTEREKSQTVSKEDLDNKYNSPELEGLYGGVRQVSEIERRIVDQKEHERAEAAEKAAAIAKEQKDYTETLREQVKQAQAEELGGTAKIIELYKIKIQHMQYEGHASKTNLDLQSKLITAELLRFKQEQDHIRANADYAATSGTSQEHLRGQLQLRQAQRRADKIAYGVPDINEEYQVQVGGAKEEYADAMHHVGEMRKDKTTTPAQIYAAETAAKTALDKAYYEAAIQFKIHLLGLSNAEEKSENTLADARLTNLRKLQDEQGQLESKRLHSQLQFNMRTAEIQGARLPGSFGKLATASSVEQLKIQEAQIQYAETEARLAKEKQQAIDDANKKQAAGHFNNEEQVKYYNTLWQLRLEHEKNIGQTQQEMDQAHYEMIEKTMQLENQQFEEIKSKAEGLFHTLFTNPKNFHKQLFDTLRNAALKPAEDILSSNVAGLLTPLTSHLGGLGGKKQPTGDKSDPIYTISSHDEMGASSISDAVKQTSNIITGKSESTMFNIMSGAGAGGGAGGGSTTFQNLVFGGRGGASSYTPGANFNRTPSASLLSNFFGGGGGSSTLPNSLGPLASGVDYGSTQPIVSLPDMSMAAGFSHPSIASQILKGIAIPSVMQKGGLGIPGVSSDSSGSTGKTIAQQWKAMGKNLKANWTGGGGPAFGQFKEAGSATGAKGVLTSKGMSQAEFAGGSMLAEAGLLGNARGTGGGIAESAAGGALIGTSIMPGIGTAIGAAAGALAGLGEMAAGVESPRHKAISMVKSTYHISISNDMADKIVEIADSKYGKNITVAVHSPEVRQMLGLYAQGTGQGKNFPMSASSPMGASLVESGGKLYQGQEYQYGVGHVYNSALPVEGGGASGAAIPSPGASSPMSLSLSINGAGAGAFLAGNVVSPDFVQSQFSNSQYASSGRVDNSSLVNDPGLITV